MNANKPAGVAFEDDSVVSKALPQLTNFREDLERLVRYLFSLPT